MAMICTQITNMAGAKPPTKVNDFMLHKFDLPQRNGRNAYVYAQSLADSLAHAGGRRLT